jgi:hypothetical protein
MVVTGPLQLLELLRADAWLPDGGCVADCGISSTVSASGVSVAVEWRKGLHPGCMLKNILHSPVAKALLLWVSTTLFASFKSC